MNPTEIRTALLSHHFIFDEANNVWRQQQIPEFTYSDGDDAENYVYEALKSAEDVSVNSADLVLKMKDWPSLYHLSARRANLLRPFADWFKGKRVLEIGCGCGAISRFLGESGARVVSVEGSMRRAVIARERCRDLTNVDVICSPSDQIPDLGQFDAVMLIGVLEYARMFLGTDGQQALLSSCKASMTPEGRLFVAIENKLGIKYLAGANEDHVNLPMYGINNSYNEQGVVTFGRLELREVLAEGGFDFCEEYLPLPDYKLPVSVVTPDGWRLHAADLAQLALESAHKDLQTIAESTFSLEQGINNIWHNGLAADLANSFLMVASRQAEPSITPGVAAFHYSDSRLPEYRKSVIFAMNPDGGLTIRAKKGTGSETFPENIHRVVDEDEFYQGNTLWFELSHIVNRPDWRLSEVGDWARGWINHLLDRAGLPIAFDHKAIVPNNYQDALPFNIIRQDNGELVFFDQEWESQEDVSIAYIGFRGILHSFLRFSSVSYTNFYSQTNLAAIALDVLNDVGFVVDKNDLSGFLSQEARFLALIQQTDENQLYQTLENFNMVTRAPSLEFLRTRANELLANNLEIQNKDITSDKGLTLIQTELDACQLELNDLKIEIAVLKGRDIEGIETARLQQSNILAQGQKVQEQTQQLKDNERIIASYETQLTRLQQQLAEQTAVIMQQNKNIDEILHSSSWRVSAPIRVLGRKTPASLRRPCRGLIRRLFVCGRAVKVTLGNALHGGNTASTAPGAGSFKRKLRKVRNLAKSVYTRAPERYKGRLLKFAMRTKPSWFFHHPSYRPEILPGDIPMMRMADKYQMGTVYLAHEADGSYHYADRPDEYIYIPTEKPRYFDDIVGNFSIRPTFSIIVPIYNTPLDLLEKMVSSVRSQWYPDWELVLVNDASPIAETAVALDAFADPRIKVIHLAQNQGIAGATNVAIERAANDYIVFLDHDDELTDDCLFELAKCINVDDADFIYSDEDKFTPEGNFSQPHFKPDWSPDTMMGTMYTCHVACVRSSVASKLGGLRSEFNGCQDWDFILRLTEITSKISHIPKVLYHWRIIPESCASDISAKPYVLAASKAVRESALKRRGLVGSVEALPEFPGYFRVNYALQGNPLISIIIPTRDNYAMLLRCVDSILTKSRYLNFEVIVVDNGSQDAETLAYLEQLKENERVMVVRHDEPFNFSQLINVGVDNAKGDLLLLLNDDTEVLQDDWLERMGGYAQLSHIGAVGAKLVYGDGISVQHMGVLNLYNGPMHAHIRQHKNAPGYFLRNQIEYDWLAVTGACLMVERKKYLSVGGFDETFPVAYNDVDFCVRLIGAGLYNVNCQGVTLIHHESVSRGQDHADQNKLDRLRHELAHFYDKHPAYYQYDPFFNINFAPNGFNFEVQY